MGSEPPAQLGPLSAPQIEAYLNHIGLPEKYHPHSNPRLDIELLTVLHIQQISTIPYENLSLHYSPTQIRKISLEPHYLFKKFVTRGNGRGGYCMEISLLFTHILRAFGFDAYPTGVRIRYREEGVPKGDFVGLVHIVNLVTLPSGERYSLDPAFGGDGPTVPMLLAENQITRNLGTQEIRFIYDSIPQLSARASAHQKFWIYQYRNNPEKPWNSFYCFTEHEFLFEDFGIMSHFTSTHPKSAQTFTVLITKFLRGQVEGFDGERIVGKMMLVNGVVKRNMGGKTEVIKICETEEERIDALRAYFGIELSEEEKLGIRGCVTELKRTVVVG